MSDAERIADLREALQRVVDYTGADIGALTVIASEALDRDDDAANALVGGDDE